MVINCYIDCMDPRDNPYTPNAGWPPQELAGRENELELFDILLARLSKGLSEQSLIFTGLHGVGKTVLLTTFEDIANQKGWKTAFHEAKAKKLFR